MPEPMPGSTPQALWAEHAWLPDGWAERVLLTIGTDGRWSAVESDVATPPAHAQRVATLLPGLVDAHSHAFQRAFAGLAERRDSAVDTFWTWRDRMYQVALRIDPAQLRAIAAQLDLELLRGGYTQVCEFHYLHHDPFGAPYADPLEMSWALADAAHDAGIGLTVMPVLYERAGFAQPALRADQRRFATDAPWVWNAAQRIAAARLPGVDAGVAVHSLRAARAESIAALRRLTERWDGPIHIHAAEQQSEVDDCLAATGQRPIAWLAMQGLLDARWNLVHATQTVPAELDAVAHRGAAVVLCPGTEANLGDGYPDLPGMLVRDLPWSIGSDSNIGRDWREELRWLDYVQRLLQRRRSIAADPARGQPSAAQRLFAGVQSGAAQACGHATWGLRKGARADALLPPADPALAGIPGRYTLDALVFSAPTRPFDDVMVAGRWVLQQGHHAHADAIERTFSAAMAALHGATTSPGPTPG